MREALRQRALASLDTDDPTALQIYADLLTNEGDPRGEFITLQLEPPDRSNLQRQEQLLAEHAAQWLGSAHAILSDVRWARGFPDAARLHYATEARPHELCTLASLRCRRGGRRHQEHQHALLTTDLLHRLRRVTGFVAHHTLVAWTRGTPRPIETLDLTAALHDLDEEALSINTGLPQLHTLICTEPSHPSAWGRWLRLPLATHLQALKICTAHAAMGTWLQHFPTLDLQISVPSGALRITRSARHLSVVATLGRLYDASPTVATARAIADVLATLPDQSLDSIDLELPQAYRATDADADALHNEIQRLTE